MTANLRQPASSALALAPQSFEPASLTDSAFANRPRDRRPCGRGITLDQLLARAHEGAQAGAATDCPVCGGDMQPSLFEAECNDCGSRLA